MRPLVLAVLFGACLIASAATQKPAPGAETPEWVAQPDRSSATPAETPASR